MLLKCLLIGLIIGIAAHVSVKAKEAVCPSALDDNQLKELRTRHQLTLKGVTFMVDGSSLLVLRSLKADDFAHTEPFIQQHGRTLNCWLKLKGDNKFFGLREK